MARGYLSESQLELVHNCVGQRVTSVEEIHWRYGEGSELEYIILHFGNVTSLIFGVGSTAEDVTLLTEADLQTELDGRDRSFFSSIRATEAPFWCRLLGGPVERVEVKDAKGYAHSSVILFTSLGATEITTTRDALNVLLPSNGS